MIRDKSVMRYKLPLSGLDFVLVVLVLGFLRGTLLLVVRRRGRLQANIDRVVILPQYLVDPAKYVVHEPVVLGDVRRWQGHRVVVHGT